MKFLRLVCFFIAVLAHCDIKASDTVIRINPQSGNDSQNINDAVKMASRNKGKPTTIKLHPGVYRFNRSESIEKLYYISNTTSEAENPNPIKHIALLLKDLKNVTIDGSGSTLLLTGEMTSFVVDNCRNIVLKNFNIDNSNPTQTECTVKKVGDDYLIVEVHPASKYKIENGKLIWYGDGWSFSGGIAQSYDPVKDVTWRSWSPMDGLKKAVEIRPNLLFLQYENKPQARPGIVFQMRDGIRDEVCGFINNSENVKLENVNFYYLT